MSKEQEFIETVIEGELDDIVCDACLNKAARINNSGTSTQIAFLIKEGWSYSDIAERVYDEKNS